MVACLICEICETSLAPDFDATLPCPKCGTKDRFRLGTRQPEPTQTGKRSAITKKRPAIAKDAETLLSVEAFEKLKAAIRLAGPGAVDLLKDAGNDPNTKAALSVVTTATEADLAEYQQELQAQDKQALEPTEPAQTRTAVTSPPVPARRRSGCLGAVLVWVFLILFMILGGSEQETPQGNCKNWHDSVLRETIRLCGQSGFVRDSSGNVERLERYTRQDSFVRGKAYAMVNRRGRPDNLFVIQPDGNLGIWTGCESGSCRKKREL